MKNETKELKPHFVYAGYYYWYPEERLRSFILEGMKKYKIKTAMVTIIHMRRYRLITIEHMENYCKGKKDEKNSVNDDLESFFEDLQNGKIPDNKVGTYFLPKLPRKELELVKRKDPSYFENFWISYPDVKAAEMRLSESDSKFGQGFSWRRTFTIDNSSP